MFGLLETMSQGLTPLAFAIGGILAEFVSLRILVSGCFVIVFLCFLPMGFMSDIIKFINFDPEK